MTHLRGAHVDHGLSAAPNLFSQLNNLTYVTLDPVYSSICGYTEDDLDAVFAPELAGLRELFHAFFASIPY